MYGPGDTLYLVSDTLTSAHLPSVSPASAHIALHSPGRTFGDQKADHADIQPPPLIYQIRITHAYTPFTMAAVFRVRLTAVYESPTALAPFIPIPIDEDDIVQPVAESASNAVGPEYVLKLYDHRCNVNVRKECGLVEPYSLENARAYHKYHQGPPAPYFSNHFDKMPGLTDQREWTESDLGLFEAWMEVDARRMFNTEVAAYNLLADLQGICIPKVFDTISCSTPFSFQPDTTTKHSTEPGGDTNSSEQKEHQSVDEVNLARLAAGQRTCGILMEFVPGVSLRSFLHISMLSGRQELQEHIASIASEAVAVILRIGKYPILNRDVRLDNMLVRQSFMATLGLEAAGVADPNIRTSEDETTPQTPPDNLSKTPTTSRCVAIDFGQSRFRFEDETDEQWRCAKLFDDEEWNIARFLLGEMREVFKKILSSEHSQGETTDLPAACLEAQKALWTFQRTSPWYRELSPEDQRAYESDPWWGQHPRNYE